jgi:hypothetical protein
MQPGVASETAPVQRQAMSWKSGDAFANPATANHIKTKGGLFSGNDQAHVNISAQGKLAYDANHTAPEDPYRWSRLKILSTMAT